LNPHLPATLKPVYDRKPAFLPDGKNVASTAKDNGNPGWINAPGVGTYDADRLAETYPKCNNTDNSKLDEADIGWMTHYTPDNMCTVIPWDYRYKPDAANPNDPGPVPYKAAGTLPKPDAFDFYSVMLHEIGHLLGLGHMTDPGGNNVMSAQIFPGTRLVISPTEKNCLKQLYCTDATPTKQESWGRIKLIYR
jgi:hypothetical protein